MSRPIVTENPWQALRRLTPARIALGRSGISQPTAPHLDFQMAHAQARDAVHRALDTPGVIAALQELGLAALPARSAAGERRVYLQRPDLGRRLGAESAQALRQAASGGCDLVFVVADGLSALAIERQAVPFLRALLELLRQDDSPWRLGPAVVVEQGRVAIGDEVGELLRARMVLVLIGERPGLSSPDSLGLYFTWAPRPGRSDAQRNCISNVRPEGLAPAEAASRAAWLLRAARSRQLTGVALKDESAPLDAVPGSSRNFLLPE
ncbi:ethanolamine ammonia-lyase subunit EutC [Azohydromonas caseinilytica]|uniref:Ethanolamine ammonia-lyase small subunit n=1 Tax=Azohydromonas caseinilytica TaxID=2728836 RepID=A0A848FE82_9BURK|nr:ethanolamine ammonia-lyase subunit EutC [Azohydromonas caseinilytica]NML16460.1 ethanolamine ammonia-lyase subunit EutC [Azohydromonas caseinilytica]